MKNLSECRAQIDAVDMLLLNLFHKRMSIVQDVAAYKATYGLPVKDEEREAALIDKLLSKEIPDNQTDEPQSFSPTQGIPRFDVQFQKTLVDISCAYQHELLAGVFADTYKKNLEENKSSLHLNLGETSYDIIIKANALKNLSSYLDINRRIFVVTDDGVPSTYLETVLSQCPHAHSMTIPQGEQSKSFGQLQRLLAKMLELGFTRGDCVIALGGGVVGDLSGFCASCYMRGIDFISIPTTLLSQVDSSIGGKTAIDFQETKNTVGAFWQPRTVIIDPLTLKTLSPRQLHAGLAEVIKMAATSNAELFVFLEQLAHEEKEDLHSSLEKIIREALLIKKKIVEEDPYEQGIRCVLNFGHTIGHALESAAQGSLLHGECVALGMLPMSSSKVRARISALLKAFDLPIWSDYDAKKLTEIMSHDKKMQDAGIKAVLVEEIGSYSLQTLTLDQLTKRYEEWKEQSTQEDSFMPEIE